MKKAVLFLIVALSFAASSFAQNSPLMITGSVTGVKPTGPYVEPFTRKDGRPVRKDTYFEISLRLQYFNRGDVPLIVLRPDNFIGTRKVFFLDIPSLDSPVEATSDEWIWPEVSDQMPRFLRAFDNPFGPMGYFKKIEPGQSVEFMVIIRAKTGFKVELREDTSPKKPKLEFAIPEYAYFKMQFSLKMKDPLPVAEAKSRLSKIGTLLTTADGDFFFETDVIINKLPD